ncbi:Aminoacylase-1 [Trichostrongylus colubriformis]|uniref:Aminoacylase-1 n=1 Tax=Trichostrongylus colubriformis TaxID=6319 RepID=A0AAN8F2T4_TRICO
MLSALGLLSSHNDMDDEDIAVTKFREYLQVNTEQPKPNYEACKEFLCNLASELGIQTRWVEPVRGKPFIIMEILGSEPDLPSIVLYSHMDVVPTSKVRSTTIHFKTA